jgi:hypothetical protein
MTPSLEPPSLPFPSSRLFLKSVASGYLAVTPPHSSPASRALPDRTAGIRVAVYLPVMEG